MAKEAYDPYLREQRTRTGGMLYLIMIVIAVAFGGLLWQLFSGGPEVPHIPAPSQPYKVAPPSNAQTPDDAEQNAFFNSLDQTPPGTRQASAPPAAAVAVTPPSARAAPPVAVPAPPVSLTGAPAFAADGRFVAQVAALQSQDAVQPAWQRLSSRAPGLFAHAQLDVERADLGQRGVYFRVRAGYFADRANASLFCDRIRQMGQDCIPVAR
ncbi:MAG: SPOR domain-containing protein [Terricaulis sp.]